LRLAQVVPDVPLTPLGLIERVPDAFDQARLRQMGYQLKEEWGIALEPWPHGDLHDRLGPGPQGGPRGEPQPVVRRAAARTGRLRAAGAPAVRRRTAVEAMYDTVLYYRVRAERLLGRRGTGVRP